jgi:hypothetical protein
MNRKTSSIRTAIGRGGRAGFVLALAVAGVSAAVLPASASPATSHGSSISFYTLTSGHASLSGGGHKWGIIEEVQGGGGTAAMSVAISTAHLGGVEEHGWAVPLTSSDVSVSASGAMTVNNGAGKIASVKAYFTPTGHKTESANCSSGSEVVYTGKLTGTLTLNTGLKGLKLGGHLAFSGTNSLTFLDNCALSPCSWSAWDSSTNGTGAFANGMTFSYPGKKTVSDLEITNVKSLSSNNELFRIDSFIVQSAPTPKFSKSAKSLTVTAGKAGLITGAATLKNGHPTSYLLPSQKTCKFNGTTYSVSGTAYDKATYDASKPFEAHTILNGVIKIKPAGKADFEIVTLKKK